MKKSVFRRGPYAGVVLGTTLMALGAFGGDNIWRAVDNDYNGSYTNTAHWNQSRLPAYGDNAYFSNNAATYTVTFPAEGVSSAANFVLRSGSGQTVTYDGRGSTFTQPAIPEGSYNQWDSFKFNNNAKLERNGGGAQLTKIGAVLTDFLCTHANGFDAHIWQGMVDFSRNGGRTTLSGAVDTRNTVTFGIHTNATFKAASFDWRSSPDTSVVDVDGGTFTSSSLTHPTSEGYTYCNTPVSNFRVRNGGSATTGYFACGNHQGKCQADSLMRTINVIVEDENGDGTLFAPSGFTHSYGVCNLSVSGGEVRNAGAFTLANAAGSSASVNLTGGLVKATKFAKGSGTATFAADGGTVTTYNAASTDFLQGFDAATLGDKGLTIQADYDMTVAQAFTSAAGASGKLIKTGVYKLTLSGASSFGVVDLRQGSLVVTAPGGLGAGLILNGGTLPLTAGSPLVLGGALTIVNPKITVSGTMTVGTTYTLIQAKGDCTDQRDAWLATHLALGGMCGTMDCTYDSGTDTTAFTFSATEEQIVQKNITTTTTENEPFGLNQYGLLEATVGTGAAYTLGVPLTCAVLRKYGLGSLVTPATTLSIYDGIEIYDGTFAFSDAGTVAAPLKVCKPAGTTVVRTDADVTLKEMSVTSGGWIKHGAGTLTIENDGSTVQTLTATNGTVGKDGSPGGSLVRLGDGFNPPTASWTGLSIADGAVRLKGTGPNAKFNLRTSVAVGMPTPDCTVTPKLIVDACEAYTGNNSYHFFIAPNFTGSHTDAYLGKNAEVQVINGAKMRVDTLCIADSIGANAVAAPKLVVDNSTFLSSFKLQFHRNSGVPTYVPEITFRNKAKVYTAHSSFAANERYSTGVEMYNTVNLTVDDSVLACASSYTPASLVALTFCFSGNANRSELVFRNGATLWCGQISCADSNVGSSAGCGIHFAFDNATWNFGAGTNLCIEAASHVNLEVLEGGLTVNASAANPLVLRQPFTGVGLLTKTGATRMHFGTKARWDRNSSGIVELTDDTVTLACDVKVAEGALSVAPGAASGTNTVTVAAGATLDLLGEEVGNLVLAGAGTVVNGTLVAPVLKPGFSTRWTPDGVLTLGADSSIAGGLSVDLGASEANPLSGTYPKSVVIARYTGSAPDVSTWKVLKTPATKGIVGRFSAANGDVTMTALPNGLQIIFR